MLLVTFHPRPCPHSRLKQTWAKKGILGLDMESGNLIECIETGISKNATCAIIMLMQKFFRQHRSRANAPDFFQIKPSQPLERSSIKTSCRLFACKFLYMRTMHHAPPTTHNVICVICCRAQSVRHSSAMLATQY